MQELKKALSSNKHRTIVIQIKKNATSQDERLLDLTTIQLQLNQNANGTSIGTMKKNKLTSSLAIFKTMYHNGIYLRIH